MDDDGNATWTAESLAVNVEIASPRIGMRVYFSTYVGSKVDVEPGSGSCARSISRAAAAAQRAANR